MCSPLSLEVKIRYAEGLTVGKKTIRKNVFVTVSTENQTYNQNQVSTRLCEDDEVYPTWNEKLTTTISAGAKFILLNVCQNTRSKEKFIGVAKVPISDFVGDYMPPNSMHFLSYRLRDSRGEPNGIINFCVSVKGVLGHQYYGQNYKTSEIQGYSYDQSHVAITKPIHGTPYINDARNFNNLVVGVPAEWSNPRHR